MKEQDQDHFTRGVGVPSDRPMGSTASGNELIRTWQPIETAPVGEDVLLFAPSAEDRIVIAHRFPDDDEPDCWYPQHESQFRGDPYMELHPTHWMPLPADPAGHARPDGA